MTKFRSKPKVIDAWRYIDADFKNAPDWLTEAETVYGKDEPGRFRRVSGIFSAEMMLAIYTLEGMMTAREGDWIIKGIQGELYPCKPDIFEATYEPEPPK